MQINQLDLGLYPKPRPAAESARQPVVLEAQAERRPETATRSAPRQLVYPANELSEQQIAQFVRNFSLNDASRESQRENIPAALPRSVQSYLNVSTLSTSDSPSNGLIDERV